MSKDLWTELGNSYFPCYLNLWVELTCAVKKIFCIVIIGESHCFHLSWDPNQHFYYINFSFSSSFMYFWRKNWSCWGLDISAHAWHLSNVSAHLLFVWKPFLLSCDWSYCRHDFQTIKSTCIVLFASMIILIIDLEFYS